RRYGGTPLAGGSLDRHRGPALRRHVRLRGDGPRRRRPAARRPAAARAPGPDRLVLLAARRHGPDRNGLWPLLLGRPDLVSRAAGPAAVRHRLPVDRAGRRGCRGLVGWSLHDGRAPAAAPLVDPLRRVFLLPAAGGLSLAARLLPVAGGI